MAGSAAYQPGISAKYGRPFDGIRRDFHGGMMYSHNCQEELSRVCSLILLTQIQNQPGAVYIYLLDIIVKFVYHIPLLFEEAPIPTELPFLSPFFPLRACPGERNGGKGRGSLQNMAALSMGSGGTSMGG